MIELMVLASIVGGGAYVGHKYSGTKWGKRSQRRHDNRERATDRKERRKRGKGPRTWAQQRDSLGIEARLRKKLAIVTKQRDEARGAAKESQRVTQTRTKERDEANTKIDQALIAVIMLCNKQQRLIFSVQQIRALCNMVRGSSIGFIPWRK